MPDRVALSLVTFALLVACDAGGTHVPGFMPDPTPAPVTGAVTDATGTFALHGGFVVEEGRGLTYSFQSVGRPGGDEIELLDWTIDLTPDRSQLLLAGVRIEIPAEETVSRVVYPVGLGGVARPVRAFQFVLAANGLRAELVVELGPVASTRGDTPRPFSPSATVRLAGAFPLACVVHGRVVGYEAGGRPVYESVQDPRFQSAFCRSTVDEYGLRPLLRMNGVATGA